MAALIGLGTSLSYSSTQSGTYTALATLQDIAPPKLATGMVDVTGLDVGTGVNAARIFVAGVINSGQPEFTLLLDYPQFNALFNIQRVTYFWRLEFPDKISTNGTRLNFQAFITEIGPGKVELENKIITEVKMQITGVVTLTAPA